MVRRCDRASSCAVLRASAGGNEIKTPQKQTNDQKPPSQVGKKKVHLSLPFISHCCQRRSPLSREQVAHIRAQKMRRRPGIAGIHTRRDTTTALRSVGEDVERARVDVIKEQLAVFRASLEAFALKYKNDIRRCVTHGARSTRARVCV